MATIGTFTRQQSGGYTGSIRTLSFNAKVSIQPDEAKTKPGQPDFRVYSGKVELGAAWKKTSEAGRDYLSVALDDPSFAQPLNAALIEAEEPDAYHLVWSRPRPRNGD